MQDLLRDWRRWNGAERLIALLLVGVLLVGIPTAAMVQIRAITDAQIRANANPS
jgi:hypothetical protein